MDCNRVICLVSAFALCLISHRVCSGPVYAHDIVGKSGVVRKSVAATSLPPYNVTPVWPVLLKNGDMESGAAIPTRWNIKSVSAGKLILSRDTTLFHSGNASLKLESDGGTAQGQAAQLVDAEAGAKVVVSGWVRSSWKIKAVVSIQPFDLEWNPIGIIPVGSVKNDSDWTPFRKEITMPPRTKRFSVTLQLEGEGAAYLDDVTLEGVTPMDRSIIPPPDLQDPTQPFNGYFTEYPLSWLNLHKMYRERAKKNPGAPLIFLGDSITQGWETGGKEQWDKYFAPLGALNFGIGSDKTCQILWRIRHGALDELSPRLVILAVGVNNLWRGDFASANITDGVIACIQAIRKKCPASRILVIGIFPTAASPDNPFRARIREINGLLARRYDGTTIQSVRFVDFGEKFLLPDGAISRELLPDALHPNAKGYEIYASNLAPVVREMMP